MKVSDLYPSNPLRDQPVYIVGSGPSLKVLHPDYLRDKLCILLNLAQESLPHLGPVAFSNNKKFLRKCKLPIQVVKGRLRWQPEPSPVRPDNHCAWDDPKRYVFSYREPVLKVPGLGSVKTGDQWSHFDDRALWAEPDFYWNTAGGSVSIFAAQFALLCGAASIHLVGCDCCDLGDDSYVYKRSNPNIVHDYDAYARGMLRMVREARERFGVPIVSVTPFVGLGREQEQYREMMGWTQ